jgi:alpha-glucoside transport system permease protein
VSRALDLATAPVGAPPGPVRGRPAGGGRGRLRAHLPRALTVHLPLLVLCLVWLLPTIGLLVSSLRIQLDASTSGWWRAFVPPLRFTDYNYRQVLGAGGVGRAFLNSLLITLPAVSLMTTLGAVLSYALSRMRFAASGAVFGLVLALTVVPVQIVLVPVLQLYDAAGATGTWPGIWLVHAGLALPFVTYLLHGSFRELPAEMFEAAELDGADHVTCFLRVALPTVAPALASVVVFQFLWVWNDLLVSLVFLGGEAEVAPLTVLLSGQVNQTTGQDWNLLTAGAFVSMICPLFVFFGLRRFFVRGLLAGSVK